MYATCLNVNWILMYWRCQIIQQDSEGGWNRVEALPDPVSPQFGFKMLGKCVAWLDA
jgi:hypothetical protein